MRALTLRQHRDDPRPARGDVSLRPRDVRWHGLRSGALHLSAVVGTRPRVRRASTSLQTLRHDHGGQHAHPHRGATAQIVPALHAAIVGTESREVQSE